MFSSTKRKMSHQEQLVEDSLFLDGPSVDELQTIQKRKDPECSRDTQVKTQALYDYVDGLTITMNVIQPRGRKESKKQAAKIMQDVMLSSQGGQPSSAIHHHRMCYKCRQKGHYAKSCPAPQAPWQAGQQGRPAEPRAPQQGKVNHVRLRLLTWLLVHSWSTLIQLWCFSIPVLLILSFPSHLPSSIVYQFRV